MDIAFHPSEIPPVSGHELTTTSVPPTKNTPAYQDAHKSPPPKAQGHARSMTFSARNPNRLSLSFPVQPLDGVISGRQTPLSAEAGTTLFSPSTSDTATTPSPGESGDFMVIIAAQERRVLELKEELGRAEAELSKLKRQWVSHEANKKRLEMRHVEQLRPLQNKPVFEPKPDEDPEDSIARRSIELDRRKAMLIGIAKDSRRTVISGGHTRALSLLSPDRNAFQSSTFTPTEDRKPTDSIHNFPRSTTLPDTSQNVSKADQTARSRSSYQEPGSVDMKQIANDLKAGMWTFLEDLRQATIGEEALQNPSQRPTVLAATPTIVKKSSKGSIQASSVQRQQTTREKSRSRTRQTPLKPTPKPVEVGSNADQMLINVNTPRTGKKTDSGLSGIDDDWSNWDSPTSIKSPDWGNSMSLHDQHELPEE